MYMTVNNTVDLQPGRNKEIVAYAASRFVTVIPEIEMPVMPGCPGIISELSLRRTVRSVPVGVVEDVFCAGRRRLLLSCRIHQ